MSLLCRIDVVEETSQEQHCALYQFPLALLDIEEKGKVTSLKAPTLSKECQVKSPNNRAANTLRRKIVEAKEALYDEVSLGLTLVKTLPADFPKINCSLVHGNDFILGTDKGLYCLDIKSSTKNLRKITNTNQRVTKIEISESLEMIVFSQQGRLVVLPLFVLLHCPDSFSLSSHLPTEADSQTTELCTYPLLALAAFPAVQKHIHPERVEVKPKPKFFCSFDTDRKTRKMLISSENVLQLLRQERESDTEFVSTTVMTPTSITYFDCFVLLTTLF